MNLADALVPKHFSDGEQIIRQGDTADGMYFVEDGVVKITILGENGREIEVHWYVYIYYNLAPRNAKRPFPRRWAPRKVPFLTHPLPLISQINRVPAGGYLGELALVTHKPRAASAYAVGDVKLACKFISLARFSLRLRIDRLSNNTAVHIELP